MNERVKRIILALVGLALLFALFVAAGATISFMLDDSYRQTLRALGSPGGVLKRDIVSWAIVALLVLLLALTVRAFMRVGKDKA